MALSIVWNILENYKSHVMWTFVILNIWGPQHRYIVISILFYTKRYSISGVIVVKYILVP